jgi:hypothetical protein
VSGPGTAWFSDSSQTNATAFFPGVGVYGLRLTADDGALRVSRDVTVTIQRSTATKPVTLVTQGSNWKYLDDGSDQGTAWVARAFNDSAWKSGPAPLGYGDANGQLPATTTGYGPDANNKYVTTYFRRSFTVAAPVSVTDLVVNVQRDDGVVVYLNGTAIFTNNMPVGPINYLTWAATTVSGADETTFYSQAVDASLLVSGTNVLAAEIHQVNGTSSDIIFDLELTGNSSPVNQSPQVNAGADQTITLPAGATLNGTVSDDGLPLPPGLLAFGWTKVSGPGNVTFANTNALRTTATFSTSGTYVLRLGATDGSASADDDLTVVVEDQVQPLLRIESVELPNGTSGNLRLRFTAVLGQTYTVQVRDSLTTGSWRKLVDVPAPAVTGSVAVSDPDTASFPARYYRLVSPAQP